MLPFTQGLVHLICASQLPSLQSPSSRCWRRVASGYLCTATAARRGRTCTCRTWRKPLTSSCTRRVPASYVEVWASTLGNGQKPFDWLMCITVRVVCAPAGHHWGGVQHRQPARADGGGGGRRHLPPVWLGPGAPGVCDDLRSESNGHTMHNVHMPCMASSCHWSRCPAPNPVAHTPQLPCTQIKHVRDRAFQDKRWGACWLDVSFG